jgi:hypothetical protein
MCVCTCHGIITIFFYRKASIIKYEINPVIKLFIIVKIFFFGKVYDNYRVR